MKKSISLLLSILAVGTLCADDYTAMTQIELKSQSGATNTVFVVENPASITMVDSANIASLFEYTSNTENVNIYAINDGNKYSQLSKQVLSNIPMGILTNREVAANQNYTLTFNVYAGRNLKLYDAVLDSLMEMTNGGTYEFTVNTTNCPSFVAGTNVRIDDRFVIEPIVPEPTICHQYGKLIITGHLGDKVKVLDMADQVAITEQTIDSDNKVIELSSLTSGEQYKVVLGEDTMIIRVQ